MKQYICDEYTFYYTASKALREQIKQEVGEDCCWVVCAMGNWLYSIYSKDLKEQVAEVLYQTPAVYEKYKGQNPYR